MITAAVLRELADLVESGMPLDYVGVGDEVTVVANIVSAARWMEACPNDRLPLCGVQVDVRPVAWPVDVAEVPC